MACSATHPAPDVVAPLSSPWCSAMNRRSWSEPTLGPAREGHLHVLTEGLDDLGDLGLPVEPCLRGELQIGAMTTPSKVLYSHGGLRPIGHIQRPQNPLPKARPPSEDRTTKDKPTDNPPPTLLGRLNRASEERKLRRAEYGRELLAATRAAKRAVLKAQRSRHAAEDAYSARACKALNRSTIVVHNVGEIAALMELLGEAQPPYGLRTVEVRGPVTVGQAVDPHVRQMRENLEANGFELREGNSYALPQKVDQQGNQRWDEEEEEDDDEWEDDDYDDDEWEEDE